MNEVIKMVSPIVGPCIWCGGSFEQVEMGYIEIENKESYPDLVEEIGEENLPCWICESCIA